MKTLFHLIISVTLVCFISYSATGQKFDGYWMPSSTNTGIICFKIKKNGNLYSVEHYFNSGEMKKQDNLTLGASGLILWTDYGNYEYVSGNDVLLNVFFQTPPMFKRITLQKYTELTASYV